MPIILDPNAIGNGNPVVNLQPVDKVTPKVFDKALTGSGRGQTGYFNKTRNFASDMMTATPEFTIGFNKSDVGFIKYASELHRATSSSDSLAAHVQNTRSDALPGTIVETGFKVLTPFTHAIEADMVKHTNKDGLFNTHLQDNLFLLNRLATDIKTLDEEAALIQAGVKIKASEKYVPAWTPLTTNFKNNVVDVYALPIVESYTRTTKTAPVTDKDPSPKPRHLFLFSGYMQIVVVPKNRQHLNLDDVAGYYYALNTTGLDPQIDAKAVQPINTNAGFVTTRVPIKSFFDQYKTNANRHLSHIFNAIDGLDVPDVKIILEEINRVAYELQVREGLLYQAQSMTENLIGLGLDALTFVEANVPSTYPAYAIVNEIVQLFAGLESFNEEWMTTTEFNQLYARLLEIADVYDFTLDELNHLTSSHLRLMMAQNLFQLDEANTNGQLYQFKPTNTAVDSKYLADKGLSSQQRNVVMTTEPLVTVSAGAGSGKSHTVVKRLSYLAEQGEDLSKVMVLSFTNVAAKNITSRYPDVKSLTLGDLFNQMYQATYPGQVLSHSQTFANALQLVNVTAPVFSQFSAVELGNVRDNLYALLNELSAHGFKRVDIPAVTAQIAKFITKHFDMCVALMDAIGQTTLDLQPIIIHHLMMNDPASLIVPSKFTNLNYIITDESQDISTFEYIVLLTLTRKQKANLMIVGDGSQTLYEFRNSNPRFLNAIEASGVFASFRLTTNYRSEQAILMYANQFLQVIDANKFAQIQLQANTFTKVTAPVFKESVRIINNIQHSSNRTEYTESITYMIENNTEINEWFATRIANGEQIAIMAATHNELEGAIDGVNEILKNINRTDIQVEKLAPPRERAKCDISDVIGKHKADLGAIPITQTHAQDYREQFYEYTKERFKDPTKAFVPSYVVKALDKVFGSDAYSVILADAIAGNTTPSALNGMIVDNLIRHEIHLNSVFSVLNRQANQDRDLSQYPIIATTVHSAKGLEFDHTFVIYNEAKNGSRNQESLRLFGVALTRAKKSQMILNAIKAGKPGQTTQRMVTDQLTGMFATPMETAYLRTLNDIDAIQNNRTVITAFNSNAIDDTDDDTII